MPQHVWPEIEREGTKFGLSPREVRDVLKARFPRGTDNASALEYLNASFDLEGYMQYRKSVGGVRGVNPVSLTTWQQMPEHLRLRRMHQRHVSTFDQDDYGKIHPEAEGYTRRKNESFLYPTSAVTKGSHLSRKGGSLLTTFKPEKLMKRQQLFGAHERVQLHGPNISGPRQAPMRAGPMSRRPDTFQTVRAALVVGGDPGPAGQFFYDKSLEGVSQRFTKTIWDKGDRSFSALTRPGTEFAPGKGYQLAPEHQVQGKDKNWGHRVLNVRQRHKYNEAGEIIKTGYEFAMERFTDQPNMALLRSKAVSQKAIGVSRDLSGITDAQGNPLNVQMFGGLKDIGGYAYSHFMAKDIDYLSRKLNMTPEQLRKTSYSELGDKPLQALQKMIKDPDSGLLQTVYAPTRMPSGRTHYQPYQALVGEIAVQASMDSHVRQPRLSADEMRLMYQQDPQTARRLSMDPRSRRIGSAYRNIIKAGLATSGHFEMPSRTLSGDDPRVAQQVSEMFGRVRTAAREANPNIPTDQPIPRGIMQRHFAEEWEKQNFFMNIKGTVLPPGRSLNYFRASGQFADEEVAKLTGRTFDLLSAYASGDSDLIADQSKKYRAIQAQIAGGKRTLEYAQSVFPSKRDMYGGVALGHSALASGEVYVPGMGGQAVHMMRFPSQGTEYKNITLQSLTKEQAIERGLDPKRLYAGIDVQQALAGDYDGDLDYAIRVGDVTTDEEGKLVAAANGQRITSQSELKELARKSVRRGAANLREESAPFFGKGPSLSQARDDLMKTLANPYQMTSEQVNQSLTEGRKRYGVIGRYYNTYRAGLATAPESGQAALRDLFNVSHSITQRPAELPPELQSLQDLTGYNLKTGGFYQIEKGKPANLGTKGGSFTAVRDALSRNIINARGEKGYYQTPEQIAQMIATPETAKQAEGIIKAYRQAGGGSEHLDRLRGLSSNADWFTQSTIGRMYGGQLTRRATTSRDPSKRMTLEEIANIDRIGMPAAKKMAELGQMQHQAIVSRRKPDTGMMSTAELEKDLAQRVRAAQAQGDVQLAREKPRKEYMRPQIVDRGVHQPTASQVSTRQNYAQEASAYAPAAGGGAAPPATPPPTGGGGGEKPPLWGGSPPYDGGQGGGSGGGSGDDPRRRIPIEELVQAKLTPSKVGKLKYLQEHLPTYASEFRRMREASIPISRERHGAEMFQTAQYAAELYTSFRDQERQAHAIANDPYADEEQRLTAKRMLGQEEGYDNLFDLRPEDMRDAFWLSAQSKPLAHRAKSAQKLARTDLKFHSQRAKNRMMLSRAQNRRAGFEVGVDVARMEAANAPGGAFGLAQTYQQKFAESQQLVGRLSGLRADYERGSPRQKRQLAPQINELASSLKALKEEATPLASVIKSHREELKETNKVLKENRGELSKEVTQLRSMLDSTSRARRFQVEDVEGRRILAQRERGIYQQLRAKQGELAQAEQRIGQVEGLMSQLQTPTIGGRTGRVRPPQSLGSKIWGGLQRTYDPQRMFYGSMMLSQGYYMLGMPLMRAREEFMQGEMSRGRMQYALGTGGISPDIARMQQQQALLSDVQDRVGHGVNKFLDPFLSYAQHKMQSTGGGFFEGLGQYGTAAVGGLMAAGGARMLGVAGAAKHASLLPQYLLGVQGGGALGGVGLGIGGYEAMRSTGMIDPNKYASTSTFMGLPGALTSKALISLQESTGMISSQEAAQRGQVAGSYWDMISQQGPLEAATTMAKTAQAGLGMGVNEAMTSFGEATGAITAGQGERHRRLVTKTWGKYIKDGALPAAGFLYDRFTDDRPMPAERPYGIKPGTTSWGDAPQATTLDDTNPMPVKIVDIQGRLKEAARGRINRTQAQDIITAFSEATGFQQEQVESPRAWSLLTKMTRRGLNAGIDPEQLVKFIGQAPGAGGFMPGSSRSMPLMRYISQFGNMTDITNRMESLKAISAPAQQFGLDVQTMPGLAEWYKRTAQGQGTYRAGREVSQLFGLNAYDFSDNMRKYGMGEGLYDEQGLPTGLQRSWQIKDRQHVEDFQIGQQRGSQQIQWQREKLALEKEFWDFRTEARDRDFRLSQRQYEITIKQMRHNLEMEEKRAELAKKNYQAQYAINKQIFDLQTQYKLEDFDRQETRMNVQRGWEVEDMATNRSRFETQFGWQMEDFERKIRYASGRQRIDLRRQRQRAATQASWKREDMDKKESRSELRFEWAVEDLDTAKERFKELRPLQEEMMRLQYESWQQNQELAEKDREFRKQMMEEQMELMEARKEDAEWQYNKQKELGELRHQQQVAETEARIQWKEMDQERAKRREAEYQEMLAFQRKRAVIEYQFQMARTIGFEDAAKKSELIRDYWQQTSQYAKGIAAAMVGEKTLQQKMMGHAIGLVTMPETGVSSPNTDAANQEITSILEALIMSLSQDKDISIQMDGEEVGNIVMKNIFGDVIQ